MTIVTPFRKSFDEIMLRAVYGAFTGVSFKTGGRRALGSDAPGSPVPRKTAGRSADNVTKHGYCAD
jgi:hypothetical protein